ncbi:hypothetical protein N0V82_008613 [Gnomoniopsis sp. IMI 355080]|nr:hypothetical protein N0V82_008613 [Gnomoniopsis sp. IMI 355080]
MQTSREMGDKDFSEKGPPGILSSASSANVLLKEELPNGGLQAWLQVLGAFFMYFNTWGKLFSSIVSIILWQQQTNTVFLKEFCPAMGAIRPNGIIVSASGFGGVVYPIMIKILIPQIGFRYTSLSVALVILLTLGVSNIVMRPPLAPRAKRAFFDRSALVDVPYLLFVLGCVFAFLGLYTTFFYVATYAEENDIMSEGVAAYLVTVLNAASVPGRILPNIPAVTKYLGPLNMMVTSVFSLSLLVLCLNAGPNAAGLFVLVILYGFFTGAFFSLQPTIFTRLTTDANPSRVISGDLQGSQSADMEIGTAPVSCETANKTSLRSAQGIEDQASSPNHYNESSHDSELNDPEAPGLQSTLELEHWYADYMAQEVNWNHDTLSVIVAVDADDLNIHYIEAQIREKMSDISISGEFCTKCQDLLDNWPGIHDPSNVKQDDYGWELRSNLKLRPAKAAGFALTYYKD